MPKVSVIIPVYNTEEYLEKCLYSIVNQTLNEIEIICVDDGSTDNSLQILKKYAENDNRIKVITQENSGAAVARNNGIDNAKGEYLYFIDSDDYVDLSFLEKMYNQSIDTDSDICLCQRTDYDMFRNRYTSVETAVITKFLPSKIFNVNDISDKIFQFCEISVFTKLYKTEFIKSNKIRFQNLKSCNDVFFYFITLALAQKITYVNEFLVTSVRCRKGSITSSRGDKINNIIIAAQETKKSLDKTGVLKTVQHSFYKRLAYNFYYELSHCNDEKLKKEFNINVKKFLPVRYFIVYKKYLLSNNMKNILNFIFSITNIYENNIKYKKISVLGIKLKIKLKNLE